MTFAGAVRRSGRMIKAGVLTLSDRSARGEREDGAGPLIEQFLASWPAVVQRAVLPDEPEDIATLLCRWADQEGLDLIITTGGTGLSPRDNTPEATLRVVHRLVPGIPEALRAEGLKNTPRAMLSRGVAGVRGRTLIINLPGSPRGVKEAFTVLAASLPHALEVLRAEVTDCAATEPGLSS